MTATPIVLLNAQVFVDGSDLTGISNKVMLTANAEGKEFTTFGSGGWKQRASGLITAQVDHAGYLTVPDPDDALFAALGVGGKVATITSDILAGSVGYGLQVSRFAYQPLGGEVGEMAPLSGSMGGDSPDGLVRGQLLLPKTSLSGTTTGTGFQLGALTSGHALYVPIHVFTAGTTAAVRLQSSVDNTWASPTTRATQTVTATGGFWLKSTTAVTDTWWRVRVDTVTGSFVIAALASIQ